MGQARMEATFTSDTTSIRTNSIVTTSTATSTSRSGRAGDDECVRLAGVLSSDPVIARVTRAIYVVQTR